MLVRERSTDNAVGTGDFYYDIVERSTDNAAAQWLFIMSDTMDGLVTLSELLVDKEVRSVQYLPKGVALRLFLHRKRIM